MLRVETIHDLNLNIFSMAARQALISSVAIAKKQKREEEYARTDDIAHGIIYEGRTPAAKLLISCGLGKLQTVPLEAEAISSSRISLEDSFDNNFTRDAKEAFLIGAEAAEERKSRKIEISTEDILRGIVPLEDTDFERLLIAHGKSRSELRKLIDAIR